MLDGDDDLGAEKLDGLLAKWGQHRFDWFNHGAPSREDAEEEHREVLLMRADLSAAIRFQQQRIAELERERDEWARKHTVVSEANARLFTDYDRALAAARDLRAKVRHAPYCARPHYPESPESCDCGVEAVLARTAWLDAPENP